MQAEGTLSVAGHYVKLILWSLFSRMKPQAATRAPATPRYPAPSLTSEAFCAIFLQQGFLPFYMQERMLFFGLGCSYQPYWD